MSGPSAPGDVSWDHSSDCIQLMAGLSSGLKVKICLCTRLQYLGALPNGLSPETWFPHSMVILRFNLRSWTAVASPLYSIGQNRAQSPPVFKGRGLSLGGVAKTVFNPSHNQIQAVSLHLWLFRITSLLDKICI